MESALVSELLMLVLLWTLKVHCETITDGIKTLEPWKFKLAYDKLIVALGAEASTFGIHGVNENAIFLREVHHAQEIRRKLLLNLMLSDVPGMLLQLESHHDQAVAVFTFSYLM